MAKKKVYHKDLPVRVSKEIKGVVSEIAKREDRTEKAVLERCVKNYVAITLPDLSL